jgi:hypothetical protein
MINSNGGWTNMGAERFLDGARRVFIDGGLAGKSLRRRVRGRFDGGKQLSPDRYGSLLGDIG